MPNSTYQGYNKLLSGMSVLYKNHRFVAENIWKPLKVKASTGNYLKFDKTLYNYTNTLRGTRQAAVEGEFGWVNDVYAVDRHAFASSVYDDEAKDVDGDVDLSIVTVNWVKEKLLLEQEIVSFGPQSPINSTSSTNNGYTTTCDLSTLSTADWMTPINLAAQNIELNAGLTANTLVMHPDTMRNIVMTTQFQESTKYVIPTTNIGGIMLPTQLLGLPVTYVQGIANTANDGQSVSNARIMPNNIWVGYIADQPMQKYVLTYGARFWNEDEVVVERILNPRSNKYITEYNWINKVIAPECGALITCTLATGF